MTRRLSHVLLVLFALLPTLACSSGPRGASAVQRSLSSTNWLMEQGLMSPDGDVHWIVSGGGGGGGSSSGLLGKDYRSSFHKHYQAEVRKEDRGALIEGMHAEYERLIVDGGGRVHGRGRSGEPLTGFSFGYTVDGVSGEVRVQSIDGEGGLFHVLASGFEVR